MRKLLLLLCCWCSATVAVFAQAQFSTDVPLLRQEQLNSSFWQTKLTDADKLLLSAAQIAGRNQQTFAQHSEMQRLQNLPAHYSKTELTAILQAVSSVPKAPRLYADGSEVTQKKWQQYTALLALQQLKAQTAVQFGLVVKRTALRAFPTEDRVFNAQLNTDLDRFAETALFVADAVAVLHQSRDQQWLLVRSFNYTGWVKAADVAIGSKEQVFAYTAKAPFLITSGAKVRTAYNPEVMAVSELQLDMGIRLPQLSAAQAGFNVHGQNPAASYIVQLPLRRADGSLTFTAALIPRSEDMHQGYLPFTATNIVAQAFKFLGERYGWGHDYNGRDCTGFISEIFRSFGFLMPRNSGQQGHGTYGSNIRFDSQTSATDKLAAIKQAQVGDLLYFPGHVSLYLGMVDEQPFMIHDVNTLVYPTANGGLEQGALYHGILNGVVVTPLLPLNASPEQSYLDALYAIKSLR